MSERLDYWAEALRWFFIGLLCAIAGGILGGFLYIALGGEYMGADAKPGNVERQIANMTRDSSISVFSPHVSDPLSATPAVLKQGESLFHKHCDMCHGDSDKKGPLQHLVYPGAPRLLLHKMDDPPAQLYWVVDHGIRFTGMPAFGKQLAPDQIWTLVTFLKHHELAPQSEQGQSRQGSGRRAHSSLAAVPSFTR